MATHKTPGVYVKEISNLPPSVAQVPTSIPAFIGYTGKAQANNEDLTLKPFKISSIGDYEQYYGHAQPEPSIEVTIKTSAGTVSMNPAVNDPSPYLMYYALQLFFDNGGGQCYVVSVGAYHYNSIDDSDLKNGLDKIAETDEVRLILFPDAVKLDSADRYYGFYKKAMEHCARKNRFTIMDVWESSNPGNDNIKTFRDFDFGAPENLRYAAAYYPQLVTKLSYRYNDDAVAVVGTNEQSLTGSLAQLYLKNNILYQQAKDAINHMPVLMPPSAAIAGIYAHVDNTKGVWKAPANVIINSVVGPYLGITDADLDKLNVDPVSGKSVNTIRFFRGKGTLIWGARTLAGNDNDWRYIPVRRFAMMVEESCKKSTQFAVFEPNDANTWTKVQGMIQNFLTSLWRQGALQGSRSNEAFFVRVGLGTTMTAIDMLGGRMNVEIGMAVVRPAEFIILRFSHKMAEA